VDAQKRRDDSIKAQSQNLFGKNFTNTYTSPSITSKVKGYEKGDELHHRAIISVYEPFFTGLSKNEQLGMIDELASMGVFVGNNPRNLTPMSDRADHQGGIHMRANEYGLQLKGDDLRAQGKQVALNGELMPSANEFFDKMRSSSYDQRIQALPDFVKYGQDEIDRVLREDMGYEVPTRAENRKTYSDLVNAEHNEIVLQSRINNELKNQKMPRTGQRRAGAAMDILLDIIRE
jgi:hypothetical protein